ncbi:MAG TPA: AAA family ATPase [Verrucomicrobiae bacterium]|nr:AAA family ATPase [Verrucomicrobiae bacterium]
MADEIERRWLVGGVDLDLSALESKEISQAYPNTPPEENLRVRIIDGNRAVMTYKRGLGLTRDEYEQPLDLVLARGLHSRFPLKISKRRYRYGRYEIDLYRGALAGLIVVEREQTSVEDTEPVPGWMRDAVEVTDSVNNLVIARLAKLLEEGVVMPSLYNFLLPHAAKVVVLTGGPASGKSTAKTALESDPEIAPHAHFVPEVATFFIGQVGIKPPDPATDPVGYARFQQQVARIQLVLEEGALEQAARDGKKVVILDRGLLDNAAYLKGGLEELQRLTDIDVRQHARRYHRVIHLAAPPEEVYDRVRSNNPARRETYAQACALSESISEAWRVCNGYTMVGNSGGWPAKYANVRLYVLSALASS